MIDRGFQLNEQTLPVVEEIGQNIPGGFFIYKAEEPGELIYANPAIRESFGCDGPEEFRALTGNTFRGMLHPDDYETIQRSIEQQIGGESNQDHVEYRIVRRDGSIRWLDDYGRYTETEEYGGIFFVFASDITEKRERMASDLAVRQAVIEALSKSYHTMWLINDVETECFSLYRGDIDGETDHAVPIRDALGSREYSQAKEYYIRTTVAEADRERLQKELTLEALTARLKERPQFHVNYLRIMKDGSERYFRIEFAKMDMPDGKMGIVCGFKDVDEEIRAEQALEHAKQEELEHRIALQEKLLEKEQQHARQDMLITSLASDYWSVYYLELDKDEGVCYQSHSDVENGFKVGEHFPYLPSVTAYAKHYITDQYREEFLHFIQPESIREGLKNEQVISYRYMVHRHGRDSYETVRFARVHNPGEKDDQVIRNVSACFQDVDAETRRALDQSQALSDALSAAEDANRAKTTFLSNMSHEIRTPMNAIIGLDNIALNDPDISERTREHLEKIGTSAQHLLNIINDILDMSRIESGKMTIKNEEFSFSKTLEQVNTIISGQCRDKLLDYECRIRGNIDEYYIGDDMKLRQIMINILGNAVKFTPEGGKIEFTVEKTAQYDGRTTLRMTIKDTGIGMSRDYLPRIFDAFSQEDATTTSKYGSTGLGLPITKNLVELMNGHIDVESEKGVGTTFIVVVTLTDSNRNGEEPATGEVRPDEMCVLVIDDDPVACEHAQVVLGKVGIRCETALSGEEGMEMVRVRHARREPYNLILVDWKMPQMDGLETTKQIRSVVGHESAIIILTSYNWEDIESEAKQVGVDSFVPKPLFASTVLDEFAEAFRKKNVSLAKERADLKGRRILLAEDVGVNAEIMVMVLAMREMDVDVAENGKIAVDMFAEKAPGTYDAILMDMRMPVMDGLEATRVIRAMDREDASRIPIIALTANAFDEDVQRSMQAGLNAHLSKPVEPEALFDTLENLIRP